jgi:CO dehydrogenase/acetyl-CoA synthase beta subunit
MPDTRTVKKILNWKPPTKRSHGRPKYRWEDNIKQDICQMMIKNWIACVQDRGKWKEVVEKAKTFNYEVQRLEEEEEEEEEEKEEKEEEKKKTNSTYSNGLNILSLNVMIRLTRKQ